MKRMIVVACIVAGLAAAAPARANYVCQPVDTLLVCVVAEPGTNGGQVYTYGYDYSNGNQFSAGAYAIDDPSYLTATGWGYVDINGMSGYVSSGVVFDKVGNVANFGAFAGSGSCYAYAYGYASRPIGTAGGTYYCP